MHSPWRILLFTPQFYVDVHARSTTWVFFPSAIVSVTPTHLFHTSFELLCCEAIKFPRNPAGAKIARIALISMQRAAQAPHLVFIHTNHIAFYGEQLQRLTTPHAASRFAHSQLKKKHNFTFSRSGECFIFEGDLRAGKWGEKARGVCAAGLFPAGAAATQSLNTMQSGRSHTHRQNDKTANKGNYAPSVYVVIYLRVCSDAVRRSARTSTAARFSFNPFIVHAWNMLVIMPLMSLLQINTFRGRRRRLHSSSHFYRRKHFNFHQSHTQPPAEKQGVGDDKPGAWIRIGKFFRRCE